MSRQAKRFAKINRDIWSDPDFRQLTAPAQYLFVMLVSHPSLNLAGVGDWRPKRLQALAKDLTVDFIEGAAAELEHHRYVLFDADTEEYLVRSFFRNDDCLRNPNMGTGAARDVKKIASEKLMTAAVFELRRLQVDAPKKPGLQAREMTDLIESGLGLIPPQTPSMPATPSMYPTPAEPLVEQDVNHSPNDYRNGLPNDCFPSSETKCKPLGKQNANQAASYNKQTNFQGVEVVDLVTVRAREVEPLLENFEKSQPAAATAASLPTPAPAPEPVLEAGNPSDWSTAADPRCRQHAHWQRDHVPACRACGQARKWFEQQKQGARNARLAAIEDCEMCDNHGFVTVELADGSSVVTRCDHETYPNPQEFEPEPEFEQESDPEFRRQLLEQLRARWAQKSTTHANEVPKADAPVHEPEPLTAVDSDADLPEFEPLDTVDAAVILPEFESLTTPGPDAYEYDFEPLDTSDVGAYEYELEPLATAV
ncbi:MAG: hypothetical protein Q4A82_00980 [Corynebacterium sp.]|nr:hypothetical protein [Corynebacterium sp.]